jgi:hypothetical protein
MLRYAKYHPTIFSISSSAPQMLHVHQTETTDADIPMSSCGFGLDANVQLELLGYLLFTISLSLPPPPPKPCASDSLCHGHLFASPFSANLSTVWLLIKEGGGVMGDLLALMKKEMHIPAPLFQALLYIIIQS